VNANHARILLIDNYDSFTYNLVQAFCTLGAEVLIYRNDKIDVEEALALKPTHLVVSPGPGRPRDAGISLAMIAAFAERTPILGVCLGHQCLVSHFGGEIIRADRLMHGKTSLLSHDGKTIFADLPASFEVGRYHSLIAEPQSLPRVLEISAQTDRAEIMGVRHRELPLEGVQFHPESILTPDGDALLANFVRMTAS
jgi:anthranilate synthase/aminodeoxychorismate synthase-like glutamine amidotransferase